MHYLGVEYFLKSGRKLRFVQHDDDDDLNKLQGRRTSYQSAVGLGFWREILNLLEASPA